MTALGEGELKPQRLGREFDQRHIARHAAAKSPINAGAHTWLFAAPVTGKKPIHLRLVCRRSSSSPLSTSPTKSKALTHCGSPGQSTLPCYSLSRGAWGYRGSLDVAEFVEEEKYMDQLANLLISGSPSVLALYAMNNVQVVSLVLAAGVTVILIARRRSRRKKA